MKIAILGHHSDLFPGFNSLMTGNMAYGFSQAGHEVTILLPNTKSHPQVTRLEELGLNISQLDRFGAEIDIRVIDPNDDFGHFDLGVWQSYFENDEAFFPSFRRAVRVVAKNFPRLLVGDRERDIKALAGSANRFDIVGLALKGDVAIAESLSGLIPDAVSRAIYMPRGFRGDWFNPSEKPKVPVFGIEKGVDTDNSEYAYLIPVIKKLRSEFGEVKVIGARLNDPEITTSTLGLLPSRDFYAGFLNPLWVYLMIDVNRSRQSMNAVQVAGRTVYPGLYENQVVEAQLAGAAVVGHQDALPEELIASKRTGLRFSDFDNTKEIYDFLEGVILNRKEVAAEAVSWAKANHSVSNMVQPLLDAL